VSGRRLAAIARLGTLIGVLLAGGVAGADARSPERPAPAEPRHAVAILEVVGPSDDVARSFESDLEAQLGVMRVRMITRSALREKLRSSTRWTEGCVVGLCLAEVRARAGARMVLLAALTGSGTTFGYVVTLVRTDTGRVLAQESDRCDVCTESEAMNRATLATVKLVNAIPEQLPDDAAEQGAAIDVAVNAAVKRRRAAERRRGRRVGWALTLTGLAVAGVGAALYLAGEDRPVHGLATAAGGGGLALGGLTVLAF
jgi:hypothetical protein